MRGLLTILLFSLLIGCTNKDVDLAGSPTQLCIIGTMHDSTALINPRSIYDAIESVRPDVVLCELEAKYFTGNTYNLAEYPDLLSTNENISTYRYQQKHNIDLRPYEIEGRNDYYRETSYFEKQQQLFSKITAACENRTISGDSYNEWYNFTSVVTLFDMYPVYDLERINGDLYVSYSEAKDMVLYNTLISVAERDFPEQLEDAIEFKRFWDKRNMAMTDNILKWSDEYKGKTIVVLTGQQHKSQLLRYLQMEKEKYDLEIKEFWEFSAK